MDDIRSTEWQRGDPIGYMRDHITEFAVPAYDGARYEALVPDTLDLQERAALAVHGLTAPTDPLADYEMYFYATFAQNPPMMQHDYSSHCQTKFMESLPLMRIISGSDLNSQVDRRWMEVALHQLGPDGLAYTPVEGRPWAFTRSFGIIPQSVILARSPFVDVAVHNGRLLSVFMLYYLRDGGSLWKDAAERLVDGLVDLSVDRGRYAYYSPSPHCVVRGSTRDLGRSRPVFGVGVMWAILGLSHVYRETGYQRALELAGKLTRYVLEELRYFGEDGRFTPDFPDQPGLMHFHAHTHALQAILEYACLADDEELCERVCRGYEFGLANGNTLLGYFPEYLGSPQMKCSELCEVADMIALGLKLTEAGVGDRWDEVDRWVRNMFAEGQLTSSRAERLKSYSANLPVSPVDPVYQTTDRVVERNVGAFAGWPTANDWFYPGVISSSGEIWTVQHCCTGNSSRAIYYVWENILQCDGRRLQVNLLLNRASKWADIDSQLPYVGRVDVKVKEPVSLSVRAPEWVRPQQVRITLNGVDHRVDWRDRYADLGQTKPGDVATMLFALAERTDTVWIEKEHYELVRKGNEVVTIDPPGRICPLYQREQYRASSTRWRKIERFVSRESIHW